VNSENYQTAISTLQDNYDEPESTAMQLLNKLLKLPKLLNTYNETKETIIDVQEITNALDRMDLKFSTRDTWISYLLIKMMPQQMRHQHLVTLRKNQLDYKQTIRFLNEQAKVLKEWPTQNENEKIQKITHYQ
jgi:Protein of unknown function (DUF1759)